MLKKILSIILIIILMQSFCLTTLANSIDDLKQQKKDAEEKHTDIEKQYWEKFHIDELLRKTNKKRNSQTETQVFNA